MPAAPAACSPAWILPSPSASIIANCAAMLLVGAGAGAAGAGPARGAGAGVAMVSLMSVRLQPVIDSTIANDIAAMNPASGRSLSECLPVMLAPAPDGSGRQPASARMRPPSSLHAQQLVHAQVVPAIALRQSDFLGRAKYFSGDLEELLLFLA